ncbi:hypothetical protein JKP88DRAFT_284792 [Tribonema minus]|uniref:Disintegrin domain-containing protein n=1 Tax=Tribonema minus TaxID=303371 RepID=A0A836CNS5_9STRA|nr:hypothetical protein JKP88DRAFT_284792 [Tribonema minus]
MESEGRDIDKCINDHDNSYSEETSRVLKALLEPVMRDAATHSKDAGRDTVTAVDVKYAFDKLKFTHQQIMTGHATSGMESEGRESNTVMCINDHHYSKSEETRGVLQAFLEPDAGRDTVTDVDVKYAFEKLKRHGRGLAFLRQAQQAPSEEVDAPERELTLGTLGGSYTTQQYPTGTGSYGGSTSYCQLGCPNNNDMAKFKKQCIKVTCSGIPGQVNVKVSNTGDCTGYATGYGYLACGYTDSKTLQQLSFKLIQGQSSYDIPGGLKCGDTLKIYSQDNSKCNKSSNLSYTNLGKCDQYFNTDQKSRGCDWGSVIIDCAPADDYANANPNNGMCNTAMGDCVDQPGKIRDCKCSPPVLYGSPYSTPKKAGTPCRAKSTSAYDLCDVDDYCDGVNATCPDNVRPMGYECRPVCGPGEQCDANDMSPTNKLCDVADKCDGKTKTCPDNVKPMGTQCRPAAYDKPCDMADTCDGKTKTCVDTVKPRETMCKAGTGECDANDKCDGISKDCYDAVKPMGEVCRKSSGKPCDQDDKCDGTTKACPDIPKPATYMCRQKNPALPCDKDDYCDGTNKDCLDTFKDKGVMCRDAAGKCDKPDACDGMSGDCKDEVHGPMYTCACAKCACGTATNCDGYQKDCPPNDSCEPKNQQCFIGYQNGGSYPPPPPQGGTPYPVDIPVYPNPPVDNPDNAYVAPPASTDGAYIPPPASTDGAYQVLPDAGYQPPAY